MFPGSILNDMDSSAIVDKYDLFTFLDGSGKLENGDLGYMKARAFSWLYRCKNRCRQNIMHYIRFGERESFSHKATQTLQQCIIPALYMSCFTCFLANWIALILRDDTFVDTIKVCETFSAAI